MENVLASIRKEKEKIDAYIESKEKDVAILNQVLEPIKESTDNNTESVGNLTEVMKGLLEAENKEKSYFDKEFNKKVVGLIGQLVEAFQNYKQQDISSIASELKSSNDNISKLLNTPNQSEDVIKMLASYLNKQSIALERLTNPTDYSGKFDLIISALNNKERNQVERITFNYDQSGTSIREAVPTYKK